MTENVPLGYVRPGTVKPRPLLSINTFIVSAICIWGVSAIVMLVVPKFESIFRDFGVQLPTLTVIILALSHFLYPWGAIPALAAPVALGFLVQTFPNPSAARWLRLVLIVVSMGLILLLVIALFMPMITLIGNMSGHH